MYIYYKQYFQVVYETMIRYVSREIQRAFLLKTIHYSKRFTYIYTYLLLSSLLCLNHQAITPIGNKYVQEVRTTIIRI